MAKHLESRYLPGKRSLLWRKFLNFKEADFYICGFEEGHGGRLIGALLLADYSGGHFFYRGKVGTGFDRKEELLLLRLLKPLQTGAPPEWFPEGKDHPRLHWVKPELVCTVAYHTLTEKGLLRHPRFLKIRQD